MHKLSTGDLAQLGEYTRAIAVGNRPVFSGRT